MARCSAVLRIGFVDSFFFNILRNSRLLALLFERFSDGSVEIHFRNGSSDANMFDLTGEICSSVPCTIDDLEEVWREVIPLNWDAECHNMDPAPAGVKGLI